MRILCKGVSGVLVDYHVLIYTHHRKLMKSVVSCGSLSLLFIMKVTV
jgi:hypothetical protein